MTPELENALRATARQCWKEIQEEWKVKQAGSIKERETISRTILLSYERKIKPRFTIYQLLYHIGVINGTLKER